MNALIVRGSTNASTGSWDKVADKKLVASGVLRIKPGNTGTIKIRSTASTGNTAVIEAGGTFALLRVDLNTIEVQGSDANQGWEFVGDTGGGVP